MNAMKAKLLFIVLATAPIVLNADWYDSLLKKKDSEPASVNGGRRIHPGLLKQRQNPAVFLLFQHSFRRFRRITDFC